MIDKTQDESTNKTAKNSLNRKKEKFENPSLKNVLKFKPEDDSQTNELYGK